MLSIVLVGAVAPSFADVSAPTIKSLASLVLQFLDTPDSNEAGQLLQQILSDQRGSLETVSQIIRAERTYQNQPVGNLPREQIAVRGQTYPLSLFIPPTYQASRAYALVVCLHGFGFTGEEYLERWRTRLGEDYLLACPTYPSGAWFTR
ncbi:MAG: hypothetical protein ACXW4C_08320, partial [Nitrospira sp.]